MIIPVRCWTCGKVIGNKWELYKALIKNGSSKEEALNNLGLAMYCCRRMFLCHIDLVDKLVKN